MKVYNSKHNRIEIPLLVVYFLISAFFLYECTLGVISVSNAAWTIVVGLLVVNIILSFSSKKAYISPLLFSILLVLLMGTAYSVDGSNGDLEAYSRLYTIFLEGTSLPQALKEETAMEFGFMLLMKVCALFSLNYNWFAITVAIIGTYLASITIKQITHNYCFVLSSYALMCFVYDVFQIRFFLAYTIVVFAFQYYFVEGRENRWKFLLIVFLASLIHKSVIAYLLILFIPHNIVKHYKIVLVFFVFLFVLSYTIGFNALILVANVINIGKVIQYSGFGIQISPLTSLFITIIVLIMIFFTGHIYNKYKNVHMRSLFVVNIFCAALIPFFVISLEFERYLRPILLIDYAVVSSYVPNPTLRKVFCGIIVVLSVLRVSVMTRLAGYAIENNYFMDFLLK